MENKNEDHKKKSIENTLKIISVLLYFIGIILITISVYPLIILALNEIIPLFSIVLISLIILDFIQLIFIFIDFKMRKLMNIRTLLIGMGVLNLFICCVFLLLIELFSILGGLLMIIAGVLYQEYE